MSEKLDPSRGMESLSKEFGLPSGLMDNFKIPGFTSGVVFYRPDGAQLDWLVQYAGGRPIVDLGCGSGWLLRQLALRQYPGLVGVEPHWDREEQMRWQMKNAAKSPTFFNVLDSYVREPIVKQLFAVERPFLFLLCRPSHGEWPSWVAEQLAMAGSPSELLLVQKESTFYRERDMKPYDRNMRLVTHQGTSEDNEKFYSFIHAGNFPGNERPGEDLFLNHPFD